MTLCEDKVLIILLCLQHIYLQQVSCILNYNHLWVDNMENMTTTKKHDRKKDSASKLDQKIMLL